MCASRSTHGTNRTMTMTRVIVMRGKEQVMMVAWKKKTVAIDLRVRKKRKKAGWGADETAVDR